VLGLVAGLALAVVVVACGAGGMSKPAAPPPQQQSTLGAGAVDARAKIEALDRTITADLEKMGVAVPAPMPMPAAPETRSAMEIKASCEPPSPPPGTCGDTCTLGDAICDNARQICELADDLKGDEWAAEKCDGAKRSCEAARKECCGCR
jgi:hypothetical protein